MQGVFSAAHGSKCARPDSTTARLGTGSIARSYGSMKVVLARNTIQFPLRLAMQNGERREIGGTLALLHCQSQGTIDGREKKIRPHINKQGDNADTGNPDKAY